MSAVAGSLRADALGPEVSVALPTPGRPPAVVTPVAATLARDPAAFAHWFAVAQEPLRDVLVDAGAVLLRGFPVPDRHAFSTLVAPLPHHRGGYSGGATPRSSLARNVYEATQVPGSVTILLHQEMAYLKSYPAMLVFHCEQAPEVGGATTVGDMRSLAADLPGRFLDDLERLGISYHRNFRPTGEPHPSDDYPGIYHGTLRDGFGTDDRDEVERQCAALGMTWTWEPDGSVSTRLDRPAFAEHARTRERVYFNHVLTQVIDPDYLGAAWEPYLDMYDRAGRPRPYNTTFGDGSPIRPEDHRCVHENLLARTVAPGWQPGDVLCVDNVLTGHGREPFRGTRHVDVALVD